MRFVATSNEQRQYDKVPMPPGLLVIGDAVQVVDPCYRQVSQCLEWLQGEANWRASPGAFHICPPASFPCCFSLFCPLSGPFSPPPVVAMAAKALGQEVGGALGSARTALAERRLA